MDSYSRNGFYVFTGVLEEQELKEIEADVAAMLERSRSAKTQRSTKTAIQL
ncbi:MAG: hypothetical protein Ct9H300mP26_0260 [Acidimicrobiales bacterium]|nr:MAG: hypothetical protein Ct9H300mP26_0260 [Acidimicrobiales bacterium]